MIKLQRIDADSRLKQVPPVAFNIKRWWALLVAGVFSVATFGTAFFIPEPETQDGPTPEVEFDATDWQIKSIEQLISAVKRTDNFYQEVKNGIVLELEDLLDTMKLDYVTETQITEKVLQVIENIHEIVDENISYNDIGNKMQSLSSNSDVQNIAKGILTLNSNTVVNRLNDVRESFRGYYLEEETPGDDENGADDHEQAGSLTREGEENGGGNQGANGGGNQGEQSGEKVYVELFGEELYNKIIAFTSAGIVSVNIPEMQGDGLYICLNNFFEDLAALASEISNKPTETAQANLDTYFNDNSSTVYNLKVEIENQYDNRYERDNVVNKILDIFGLTQNDLPESVKNRLQQEKQYNTIVENDRDDDESSGDGGGGTGDSLYGSNDLIYDPDNDEHKPYGEVVDDWYWAEIEKMEEAGIPQEIIDLYKKYYDEYLMGGSSKNDNGNN